MDEKTGYLFAETFENDGNDDEATVFQIRVDQTIAPKANFVYLYHADYEDMDDCQILFSLRTLFRIENVEYSESKETWYVDMTVIDDDHQDVQRLITP